jgi:hypothetical protein
MVGMDDGVDVRFGRKLMKSRCIACAMRVTMWLKKLGSDNDDKV